MHIKTIRPLRFVNIGEDPPYANPPIWIGRRNWEACLLYNFISAGQGIRYSQPLTKLIVGDIVAAYKTGHGYVGIGRVLSEAIPIKDFKFKDYTLKDLDIDIEIINGPEIITYEEIKELRPLRKSIFQNAYNNKTEYAVQIEWIKTVDKSKKFWQRGLFASRLTQCTLENQLGTINFLQSVFDVVFLK